MIFFFLLEGGFHLGHFRTYTARKTAFEHEQLVEYFQKKKRFEEELREELKSAWKDAGYLSEHPSNSDSGEDDDDDDDEVTNHP